MARRIKNLGDDLSPKEKPIVTWVCMGMSNKEIAEISGLSEKTVKFHLTNIYAKTGVTSRMKLMIYMNNLKNNY